MKIRMLGILALASLAATAACSKGDETSEKTTTDTTVVNNPDTVATTTTTTTTVDSNTVHPDSGMATDTTKHDSTMTDTTKKM